MKRPSERELQVLELKSLGLTSYTVGRELGISENTVKNHLKSINKKVRASNVVEAYATCVSVGFLPKPTPDNTYPVDYHNHEEQLEQLDDIWTV